MEEEEYRRHEEAATVHNPHVWMNSANGLYRHETRKFHVGHRHVNAPGHLHPPVSEEILVKQQRGRGGPATESHTTATVAETTGVEAVTPEQWEATLETGVAAKSNPYTYATRPTLIELGKPRQRGTSWLNASRESRKSYPSRCDR